MPAFFIHGLHAYLLYDYEGIIYGILPDFLSWGYFFIKKTPFYISNIPNYLSYLHKNNYNINKLNEKIRPPLNEYTNFDYTLYNIFHSIFTWILIYLLTKNKLFLISILSIIIDIFLHSKDYLPTPFLYPLSNYKFDGINWGTLNGILITFIITIILYYFKDYIVNTINKF
mgnify:CR=1 FL=1|tara:strand:+ start:889 stop:1401 length:513 start_codon:yes stop_codon:yes gene_type:complete